MNCLFRIFLIVLFAACGIALRAHEGHNKAPGEQGGAVTGPVTITPEAEKNLGLKVEAAELRTLEKTVSVLGNVEIDPAKVAVVASRISGRISRLAVKEGDVVAKGDFLLEIESRQIGDPPPKVEFNAPIKGTIYEQPIFTGDSVEPEARLLTLADLSEIYLVGRLYEGQVAQVKKGQTVRIRAEAYPDDAFTGTVEGYTPRLDPETRTLGVRVRVANPEGKLLPNMRATMNIVTAEADSVITIAHAAVLGEAGNLFVFVQDDKNPHTFMRTPVVVGQRDDRYVEIIEGVLPGGSVVVIGNYQLQYVAPTAKPAPAVANAKPDGAKADAAKPAADGHGHKH
ncbi:MAG: efflux RND transporter periplasmic adaptor subunit [Opitutaceae bacterium]|nr:efflux RND transporter periplasmic adaptor subunit [Opitutaceae bacterium]